MQTTSEQTKREPEQLCLYYWIIEIKFALSHKFGLLLVVANNWLMVCLKYICIEVSYIIIYKYITEYTIEEV